MTVAGDIAVGLGAGQAAIERRQETGAFDAVLGSGLNDIERGDAEISIIGQGQFDRLLQGRIGEQSAPMQACVGRGRHRC